MAKQSDRMDVDMHAHILPLLDLCRYAAMASSAIQGLYNTADVLPEFRRQMESAAPALPELGDYGGGAVAAGGIWVAMELLREYESQDTTGRA